MSEALSLWHGEIRFRPQLPSMRQLAEEVAAAYGLTLNDLRGKVRARTVAHPRHEAWWVLRQTGRFSSPQIGAFFNRDHTTVLYGAQAHERRRG